LFHNTFIKDVYNTNTWQNLWLKYLIICKSESSNFNFDKLLSQLKANIEDDNGVELFMQVIVNQVVQTLEA